MALTYGAPFVNLLFNLFWEDFVMVYHFIYDNLAHRLNYQNNHFYSNWLFLVTNFVSFNFVSRVIAVSRM